MTDYVIETEKLSKKFSDHWAVSDLTLTQEAGSALAFLGPNGAGKTTSVMMFLDLLRPSSGTVRILGLDPVTQGVEIRRRVGYVPERPKMIGWMTVDQIQKFVASYYPTWDWDYARSMQKQLLLRSESKVQTLSRGEEAKLALLLALSHRPELLILDDATSGVDTLFRHEILENIISHLHEAGSAIFFATHLIHEVEGLIDRAAFIHNGRIERVESIERLKSFFKRVRIVQNETGHYPDLPEGAELINQRQAPREQEWIVSNFPDVDWSSVERAGTMQVEDLSLEEIYVALHKWKKE